MPDWEDYYEILGVDPKASDEEIKRAYRDKSFIFHPDRMEGAPESAQREAEEQLKKINRAYDVLKDPKKREQYNQEWHKRKGRPPPPKYTTPPPRPPTTGSYKQGIPTWRKRVLLLIFVVVVIVIAVQIWQSDTPTTYYEVTPSPLNTATITATSTPKPTLTPSRTLLSTLTPTATPSPSPRGILFSDDFSNEASGWDTYSDSGDSVVYLDGWLHLTDSPSNEHMAISYCHRTFTDFNLEAEAKFIKGDEYYSWCEIPCRSDIYNKNAYMFGISTGGQYHILKYVNDEPTYLREPTSSLHINTGHGVINKLRIECIDNILSLSVNGHLIASIIDSSHDQGDFGLGCWSPVDQLTEVAFDNIVVNAP